MRRFIAWLIGREAIALIDHDGEVTLRYAKRTPFGLICNRWTFVDRKVLCLPDGKIRGPSYVAWWRPLNGSGVGG